MNIKDTAYFLIFFSILAIALVFWMSDRMTKDKIHVLADRAFYNGSNIDVPDGDFASPEVVFSLDDRDNDKFYIVFDDIIESQNAGKSDERAYTVVRVIDGDTIDVRYGTKVERVRLIGIDTPEVVDPRKPVECFGEEASFQAEELLIDRKVYLEIDPSQDERDKYDRLLRYVRTADGVFYNLEMIKQGYAYEYTYQLPYKYQKEFKEAQNYARANKLGLWAPGVCTEETKIALANGNATTTSSEVLNSLIKGNISISTGEKIYHQPACDYYAQTKIDLERGERYFYTEAEALAAGWRKALNCP
ncbi:MAG: thermonuclease family protein [bacterium]|nr:thermonuclease family protein [bacterium]